MSNPVYQATIGLEIHVQLRTRSKIWCSCAVDPESRPNSNLCPVCLGYPGTLPVLNKRAVELTVRSGLMLGCEINLRSKHDRKSYFYPDMPKNYQISQYDQPLCRGGGVEIEVEGKRRVVQLTRIHLEEDVGKSTHFAQSSGVDYNRAGTCLMEIVTEPDLFSEEEAFAFLSALKQILEYGEISDCNLENGNIRCDVNCSLAPEGAGSLGVKTEIKNMNTFRGVHRALKYEIARQRKVLGGGGAIVQETRRWDDEAGVTTSMRSKEYAHDYRYFPDPDLMPIVLCAGQVAEWKSELPELPVARRARLVREFGLPEYDAGVLVADRVLADYYEAVAGACGDGKAASNWVMTEVLRVLSEKEQGAADFVLPAESLGKLIKLVAEGLINRPTAKEVFVLLLEEGGDPEQIVAARGWVQVNDSGAIEALVEQVVAAHPGVVDDYRGGKGAALQFLVGQVMRLSKGKANPQQVVGLLKDILAGD